MAINSIFYLDGPTLATSTTVYLDAAKTIVAPDGFYGQGSISREQSGGILLSSVACFTCAPQVQCFEGISESGGSITYIDANGNTTTQSGIALGDIVGIIYLEVLFYTGLEVIPCPLQEGLRSENGLASTSGVCDEPLFDQIFIFTSTAPVISTGDIACVTNDTNDRFNGGNLYYRVQMLIGDVTNIYICQIDEEGFITVDSACPV